MLIAGFPAGSFQANCYVLAVEPGGPCVVVDPGQDALARLEPLLAEHRLRPVAARGFESHLRAVSPHGYAPARMIAAEPRHHPAVAGRPHLPVKNVRPGASGGRSAAANSLYSSHSRG